MWSGSASPQPLLAGVSLPGSPQGHEGQTSIGDGTTAARETLALTPSPPDPRKIAATNIPLKLLHLRKGQNYSSQQREPSWFFAWSSTTHEKDQLGRAAKRMQTPRQQPAALLSIEFLVDTSTLWQCCGNNWFLQKLALVFLMIFPVLVLLNLFHYIPKTIVTLQKNYAKKYWPSTEKKTHQLLVLKLEKLNNSYKPTWFQ